MWLSIARGNSTASHAPVRLRGSGRMSPGQKTGRPCPSHSRRGTADARRETGHIVAQDARKPQLRSGATARTALHGEKGVRRAGAARSDRYATKDIAHLASQVGRGVARVRSQVLRPIWAVPSRRDETQGREREGRRRSVYLSQNRPERRRGAGGARAAQARVYSGPYHTEEEEEEAFVRRATTAVLTRAATTRDLDATRTPFIVEEDSMARGQAVSCAYSE